MKTLRLFACTILATGTLAGCAGTPETDDMVAADDSQTIVCRYVQEIGSRLSSRVCRTKEEWSGQSKEARSIGNAGRTDTGVVSPAGRSGAQ